MAGPLVFGPAMRVVDWFGGEPIRWFRFIGPCPCYNSAADVYDRTHALCHGTGKLKEEVDVSAYKAIISSVTASRVYAGIGELHAGDLTCSTWPQEIPVSQFDEVIVPSRVFVDSALIKRGAGVDAILSPTNVARDTVTRILRVYDGAGAADGWSLSGAGGVAWNGGTGPAEGEQYTVQYQYQPRWEVVGSAVMGRVPDPDGSPIPQKVGLSLIEKQRAGI